MKLIPIILSALLLAGLAPQPVKNAADSVLLITYETMNDEKKPTTMVCTAFMVNPVQAVTAEHCLPKNGETLTTGKGSPIRVIKTVGDLALLEVPIGRPSLKIAKNIERGEHVYVFGFPYGLPLQVYQRNVAGQYDGYTIIDGGVSGGMSGGPVVNESGEVMGVVQSGYPEISFICQPQEIEKLLK